MLKTFTQTGWRFLWISILVLVADQYTKALVLENIELYQAIQILPFFNLTHVITMAQRLVFYMTQVVGNAGFLLLLLLRSVP